MPAKGCGDVPSPRTAASRKLELGRLEGILAPAIADMDAPVELPSQAQQLLQRPHQLRLAVPGSHETSPRSRALK